MESDWINTIAIIASFVAAIGTAVAAWAAVIAVRLSRESKKSDMSEWIGTAKSDLATFKEFMGEVKEDIRGINNKIFRISVRLSLDPAYIGDESPLRLTKDGQEVSKELNAATWAKKTSETIKTQFEDKEAYEIQELSFMYASKDEHYTVDELRLILRYAYIHGVSKEKVQSIFGI